MGKVRRRRASLWSSWQRLGDENKPRLNDVNAINQEGLMISSLLHSLMSRSLMTFAWLCLLALLLVGPCTSQAALSRVIAGAVITEQGEVVAGVTVVAESVSGKKE